MIGFPVPFSKEVIYVVNKVIPHVDGIPGLEFVGVRQSAGGGWHSCRFRLLSEVQAENRAKREQEQRIDRMIESAENHNFDYLTKGKPMTLGEAAEVWDDALRRLRESNPDKPKVTHFDCTQGDAWLLEGM